MSFPKRFRSYLIGFGLGILIVIFIFRDRANLFTAWLPENRVLIEIYQDSLVASAKSDCQLKCLGKSVENIREGLKDNTSVEFRNSRTQQNPRIYCLVQTINDEPVPMMVTLRDSVATIDEFKLPATISCSCP
ncbi:MAG: hypothetical protein V4616_10650 [Bacteroidota bacterium]